MSPCSWNGCQLVRGGPQPGFRMVMGTTMLWAPKKFPVLARKPECWNWRDISLCFCLSWVLLSSSVEAGWVVVREVKIPKSWKMWGGTGGESGRRGYAPTNLRPWYHFSILGQAAWISVDTGGSIAQCSRWFSLSSRVGHHQQKAQGGARSLCVTQQQKLGDN